MKTDPVFLVKPEFSNLIQNLKDLIFLELKLSLLIYQGKL